jgi:HEAT repeat protein
MDAPYDGWASGDIVMVKCRIHGCRYWYLIAIFVAACIVAVAAILHHPASGPKATDSLPYRAVSPNTEPEHNAAPAKTPVLSVETDDVITAKESPVPAPTVARNGVQASQGGLVAPEDSNDEAEPSGEEVVRKKILSVVRNALVPKSPFEGMSPQEARKTGLSVLLDEKASPRERRRAAAFLARDPNSVDLDTWSGLLADPDFPPYLKATIAEGLGHSSNPKRKDLLLTALADQNEMVARGAIKGLSVMGGKDAIAVLSDVMYSPDVSPEVRSEVAMGLGRIKDPEAMDVLVNAYTGPTFVDDVEFRGEIVSAIGQRDSPQETTAFLQNVMDDETADSSLRVAAIAAMEEYSGEVGPLLLRSLASEDSEVREEAAWVLAAAEQPGDFSATIQELLAQEPVAAVRRRLYQALSNQETVDIPSVKMRVQQESDPMARMSGYGVILERLNEVEDATVKQWANDVIIPELSQVILKADTVNTRLEAVIALQKAHTPEAAAALKSVAAVTTDQRVIDAIATTKSN